MAAGDIGRLGWYGVMIVGVAWGADECETIARSDESKRSSKGEGELRTEESSVTADVIDDKIVIRKCEEPGV